MELFFRNSLVMSPLILLLLTSSKSMSKKYKAKSLYYLWAVVLLGLLLPVRMTVVLSGLPFQPPNLPQLSQLSQTEAVTGRAAQIEAAEETAFSGEDGQTNPETEGGQVTAVALDKQVFETPPLPSVPWKTAAAVLWIGGAFLLTAASVARYLELMKRLKRWSQPVTDPETVRIYREAGRQAGLLRMPELRHCKFIATPMGAGLVKTAVYLPDLDYSKDELRLLLTHELVHCKRKDLWYKLLILIVNAVHWYNPLVYLMRKEIARQCEISCDEMVLQSFGEGGQSFRKSYSMMIIKAMEKGARQVTPLSTQFGGGKKDAFRRLAAIMNREKKKGCALMMSLIILLTFCSGIVVAAEEETVQYIQPDNTVTKTSTGAIGEREFYYSIVERVSESYALEHNLPVIKLPHQANTPAARAQIRSSLEEEVSGAVFQYPDGTRDAYDLHVPGANPLSSGFIASINSNSQSRMAYYGSMELVDNAPEADEKYLDGQPETVEADVLSEKTAAVEVAEGTATTLKQEPAFQRQEVTQNVVIEEAVFQSDPNPAVATEYVPAPVEKEGITISLNGLEVVYLDCLPNSAAADKARREYFSDKYNASVEFIFADGTHLRYTLKTSIGQAGQDYFSQDGAEGYDMIQIDALPGTEQAAQLENIYISQKKPVLFQYRDGSRQVGRVIQTKGTTLLADR